MLSRNMDDPVRVWLADRTTGAETDAPVAVYATPDGSRFVRREAPAGVEAPEQRPASSIRVVPDRLLPVDDAGLREVYATAVAETRESVDGSDASSGDGEASNREASDGDGEASDGDEAV